MQARGSLRIPGVVFAAVFSAVLAVPAVGSPDSPIPAQIDGAIVVSAEALVRTVGSTPELVMIDARLAGDRRQGYIEGSVSLPSTQADCDALAHIIPDMSNPVLFYCNGANCRRSSHAVTQALQCGYRQVYWFRGGFAEWKAKGYPYLNE